MQKNNKRKKKNVFIKNNKLFLGLLCFMTLFMGICYATLDSNILNIVGKTEKKELDQVVITNVEFYDIANSSADVSNSAIVNYTSTIISSDIILSETDPNSSITMKVTVYNNSDVKSAYIGYLYAQNLYNNPDIVMNVTGIEEDEIIEPRTSKDFYVTFSYKNNIIASSKELVSLIDYQFKKVYDITYKYFYEDGYPEYIYEGNQIDINLSKDYQSLNLYYKDGTQLIYDVNYKFITDNNSYNVLSLLDINGDIEIRNLTNFCSEGSELVDCLVATDYGSSDLTSARDNIESKVADLSKLEPYLTYSENVQYNLVSTSLASSYNNVTKYYYSLEPPTFNSQSGYHTLANGGQYVTIENLVSEKGGQKKYTCMGTSNGNCANVYVIYALNTSNPSSIKITEADKYSYTLDDGYSSNPGLYAASDDYTGTTGKKSYYYRGEVNNNWVSFGGYLWRIVRVNGDGSVKLIYSGTSSQHTGSYTSILNPLTNSRATAYNTNRHGATYVGYMFNPSMVTNTSPADTVILRHPSNTSSTALGSFLTFSNMNNYTNYYFFNDFDMSTNCQNGTCTFTCNNFDGTNGDNCKFVKWSELSRNPENYMKYTDVDDNGKSGLYYGSTNSTSPTGTMYWYYKNDYKYSCLSNQSTVTTNGTTVTISCPIVMEIKGVVYTNTNQLVSDTQAKVKYYGYFSESRDAAISNVSDSNIKLAIDEWYKRNLLSYENYIQNGIFCNDRSFAQDNPKAGDGYLLNAHTYFGPRYRINSTKTASLICPNKENDGFTLKATGGKSSISGTAGFGNNMLDYPIGLLTIDEALLAGGVYNIPNSKYYLYTGQSYWSASPHHFNTSTANSNVWFVISTGYVNFTYPAYALGVRPVINLKSGILYSKGSGTATDPYEVTLAN